MAQILIFANFVNLLNLQEASEEANFGTAKLNYCINTFYSPYGTYCNQHRPSTAIYLKVLRKKSKKRQFPSIFDTCDYIRFNVHRFEKVMSYVTP